MFKSSPAAVVLIGLSATLVSSTLALAQAQPSLADRYRAIQQEYSNALRQQGLTPAQRSESLKQRDAALAEWIKEAEASQPLDHALLANAMQSLRRYKEAVDHARAAITANPANEAMRQVLITSLSSSGQLEAAEKAFAEALRDFPKSRLLVSLHYTLYLSNLNARRLAPAIDHLRAHLDNLQSSLAAAPASVASYVQGVERLLEAYRAAQKPGDALTELDARLEALSEAGSTKPSPELNKAIATLSLRKVDALAAAGRPAEARALLTAALAETDAALAARADDTAAIVRKVGLLRSQVQLADAQPDRQAAEEALDAYLEQQLKNHPEQAEIVNVWHATTTSAIGRLVRTQPREAAERLKAALATLDAASAAKPSARSMLDGPRASLARLQRSVAAELARAELIGKPAPPIAGATWLNGSPLTDKDLRGKVVLLDFWAVWCGPCIATFPHLRAWREKYEARGLEIVGVTHRYNYDWDSQAQRIKRAEALPPEQEDAATLQFLAHHQLKHRIAVMPAHDFAQQYFATAIPQAVVIDRSGAIRLIRVGSGEANAKAIEEMIEKLLAESAPPAGG